MSYAQHKFVAMKRLRPSLQLRLVVPPVWRHLDQVYNRDRLPGIAPSEIAYVPTYLPSSHMTYLVHPASLYKQLRVFRPTHILIEEDPHSVVSIEMVTVTRGFCSDAHLSFFIWDNINRRHRGIKQIVKSGATQWAFSRANLVICGNQRAKQLLAEKGFSGHSCVLPQLAVEPALYKQSNGDAETPTILFVGRLVREKGLLVLFEALHRLLHLRWRLVIVGDGPLRPELEKRSVLRMGGRISFVGAVRQDAVPPLLASANVLVLPSISTPTWQEQFGYVLAQAMMSSLAIIASGSGAIPEVLGDAGVLVHEDNVSALEIGIRALLIDRLKRTTLGELARKRACNCFSPDVVAQGYLDALGA
jgi:glycosyltransferase involved in cell wall biosynthesis